MYAWLVFLTCLSWLVFIEFRHAATLRSKITYWLLLTGLVYSHPLGLFMVAAHGLASLLVHRSLRAGFPLVGCHPGGRPAGGGPVGPPLSRSRNRLSASSLLDSLLAGRAHRVHWRQWTRSADLHFPHRRGTDHAGRATASTDTASGEPDSAELDDCAAGPHVRIFPGSTTDLRPAALSPVHCSRLPDPAGPRIDRVPANPPLDARGGQLLSYRFLC